MERSELAREERLARSSRQVRHNLSMIDPLKKTAICSLCGPIDIWSDHYTRRGKTYYTCGNQRREYERNYKRAHQKGRPTNPHALSQINEEAMTAVCATCGPVRIEIRLVNKYVTRRCINAERHTRSRKKE